MTHDSTPAETKPNSNLRVKISLQQKPKKGHRINNRHYQHIKALAWSLMETCRKH